MKKVNVTYAILYDKTNEKILMVKNKGENGSYYTLPGGAVKLGETLEEAVIFYQRSLFRGKRSSCHFL